MVVFEAVPGADPGLPPAQRFHLSQTVDRVRFELHYQFSHERRGLDGNELVLEGDLKVVDGEHCPAHTTLLTFRAAAGQGDWRLERLLLALTQNVYETFVDAGAPGLYRLLRAQTLNSSGTMIHVYHAMHSALETEIEQECLGIHGIRPTYFQSESPGEPDEAPPSAPDRLEKTFTAVLMMKEVCADEFLPFATRRDPELETDKYYFEADYAERSVPHVSVRELCFRPVVEVVARTRDEKPFNDIQIRWRLRQHTDNESGEERIQLDSLVLQGPRRALFFRERYRLADPHEIHIAGDGIPEGFFRPLFRALHETNCDYPHTMNLRDTPVFQHLINLGYTLRPQGLIARVKSVLRTLGWSSI